MWKNIIKAETVDFSFTDEGTSSIDGKVMEYDLRFGVRQSATFKPIFELIKDSKDSYEKFFFDEKTLTFDFTENESDYAKKESFELDELFMKIEKVLRKSKYVKEIR